MELLSPVEGLPCCDWLSSPRISFSQDFDVLARSSPDSQRRENLVGDGGDEFSFEFEFAHSVGLDLPSEHGMLSADELFSGGKLRLLEKTSDSEQEQTRSESLHSMGKADAAEAVSWPMIRHLTSYNDNPRCISMSMEGSREHPHRCCISLNNSRCSSPSRSFSLPPTMPASPKASSSRYSSKFKGIFRLRKTHIPLSREVPSSLAVSASLTAPAPSSSSSSSSSSSAAISRESSVSSSCRLPLSKRSFWPFSRSNSAGESKSGRAVSPPPRRSNSAGESKTSSSSVLPSSQGNTPLNDAKANNTPSTDAKPDGNQPIKKGLPPLPNIPTVKKGTGSHSFRVPAHCGTDAVVISSRSVPSVHLSSSSTQSQKPTCMASRANGNHFNSVSADHCREGDHNAAGASAVGCVSPVRRISSDDAARSFARESPNRGRGMWDSPSRGSNGGRGAIRSYERGNGAGPKGLVRPKDMLARDTASIRVTPVLNVPACITPSLRGTKSMPRVKLFSLGNIFFKKEREVYSYGVLLPSGKQNGA